MKQYVEINVIREQIGERFGFPVEDVIEDLPIANDVQEKKYCRMIPLSDLEEEIRSLKELLREIQPVLRCAFFAHYTQQNEANELCDKITEILGRE